MKKSNPFPEINHNGNMYKLRSKKTIIPDFSTMSEMEILVWLVRNTWAKGYQKQPDPLIGLGISIN